MRYINLDVRFSYEDMDLSQKVAPLLFEVFISNAFKYVKTESGYIHIRLYSDEDNAIYFTCENSIGRKSPDISSTKSGIYNVTQRLHLIYPNKHDLKIEETGDVFRVSLIIRN